jgi:crotonobetainyl-CoA:carnitine CoA-transferase CaiB-like acyl-CoA transferase
MSGLTFTSGLRDQPPAGWGYSYMDHTGAYYMAMALLMALYHRERTGEGQWIDLAMTEAGTTLNGPALLDYTVNGRRMRREGMPDSNRSQWPRMAPHGIYPAKGEDAWVAISCRNDADWTALRYVVGEGWTRDRRFTDLDGRIASEDALDKQLAAWTSRHEKFDLQTRLQAAGIPAAAVQTPPERIDRDANTKAWGLWPEIAHPVIGKQRIDGLPVHLSETDWRFTEGGPLLGQHNEQIYGELLGLDASEIAALEEEGVI